MNPFALLGLLPLVLAAPAAAAGMDPSMPGMVMPNPHPAVAHAARPAHGKRPVKARTAHRTHHRARHQMAGMSGVTSAPAAPQSVRGAGQDMAGMPGMRMPTAAPPGGDTTSGATGSQPGAPNTNMAGMAGMKGMDMSGTGQGQPSAAAPAPNEPEIPNTPPPPPPTDHAADRYYDPVAMGAARAALRQEHGGAFQSMVMVNLAEYQAGPSGGGYRWEGEARFGGDINRFVMKSEGDGSGRSGLGAAEVQGLYARAVDPYFDVQAGVRQDFGPGKRTYATAGVEGLLPYWFDLQAAVFLSNRGELLGRLEGTYDLRLTQRLILQPRAELNFAAQDTSETRTGSGLSNAELGLRLRYEIRREFAPYIGVSYDGKFGKTADYARASGEAPAATSFVVGIRAWF